MENSRRPLLTFALLAFNQEKFVAEAVAGALSQAYSPLEIVLSDDASKDKTFAIMTKMCRDYSGPHAIKLNCNPRQRGLGGHLDRIMEIAEGELIVVSAGDDISLPERTSVLFHAWASSGRRATSLYSDYVPISESGKRLQAGVMPFCGGEPEICEEKASLASFVESLKPNVFGCTHAFVPLLFSSFGPLTDRVTYEDMALSFRSHAIGSLLHVKCPLILYRRHGENLSFHNLEQRPLDDLSYNRIEEKERRMLRGFLCGYDGFANDLRTLLDKGLVGNEEAKNVRDAIEKGKRKLESSLQLLEGRCTDRIKALVRLYRIGGDKRKLAASAARCLPRRLYKYLRIMRNRMLQA
jgi:glycosyltransferase involved in cell wall biosynthesis